MGTASTTSASALRLRASSTDVMSKPSARALSASSLLAVAPHTVRPAAFAARSTEPPISPSPITHTSRTRPSFRATRARTYRRASSAKAAYVATPCSIAASSNSTRFEWFGAASARSMPRGQAPRNANAPGTRCNT